MMKIRTKKGKMYGILDTQSYTLHIKDGKDERIIQVPKEGLKLRYVTGNSTIENIVIPPKTETKIE